MKLQDGENILANRTPEKQVLTIWFFTKLIPFMFFFIFFLIWCFGFFGGMYAATNEIKEFNPFERAYDIGIFAGPVLFILLIFYYNALLKTFKYTVTNRRCVFIGGIVRRAERSIPFHKVTDVERSENILDRIVSISRIKIFTLGTASMNMNFFNRQSSEITYDGLSESEELV